MIIACASLGFATDINLSILSRYVDTSEIVKYLNEYKKLASELCKILKIGKDPTEVKFYLGAIYIATIDGEEHVVPYNRAPNDILRDINSIRLTLAKLVEASARQTLPKILEDIRAIVETSFKQEELTVEFIPLDEALYIDFNDVGKMLYLWVNVKDYTAENARAAVEKYLRSVENMKRTLLAVGHRIVDIHREEVYIKLRKEQTYYDIDFDEYILDKLRRRVIKT